MFVFHVGTWPRQFDWPERQSSSMGLRLDQCTPNRMHSHALSFGVESRDQRGNLDVWLLPEKMQRPGAVFAAAPR
jgi:hypothetical protein